MHRRTGLTPGWSVATDRIAHPALRWAGIEARLRDRGLDAARDGSGMLCEVYPAAALQIWVLHPSRIQGCEEPGASCRAGRHAERLAAVPGLERAPRALRHRGRCTGRGARCAHRPRGRSRSRDPTGCGGPRTRPSGGVDLAASREAEREPNLSSSPYRTQLAPDSVGTGFSRHRIQSAEPAPATSPPSGSAESLPGPGSGAPEFSSRRRGSTRCEGWRPALSA